MAAGYNKMSRGATNPTSASQYFQSPVQPTAPDLLPLAPFLFFPPLNPTNAPAPTHQETSKKRTRRTVKQQRGIVGLSYEVIKDRRSQRPEAREAARKEAIAKGKEKKATAESKKKAEKAKSAAGAARGQPGRIQSKMGSKGVPNKASGKTR